MTGLELGAEDYVAKPFSLAELLARVRAALRRGPMQSAPREATEAAAKAPAAAAHAAAQSSQVTPDAQKLTTHYLGKHKKA